jgi:serine/threonine protein kinase
MSTMWAGPYEDPDRFQLGEVSTPSSSGALFRSRAETDLGPVAVALKVIQPRSAEDLGEWRQRWQRNADALSMVRHPGLVRVVDMFEGPLPHPIGQSDEQSQALYLVTEWVDGLTLEDWVVANPHASLADRLRVVTGLAFAVDYLQSGESGHSLLHRDITPADVIVSNTNATLIDFGHLQLIGETTPTTAIGQPAYWAPEVSLGDSYTDAADRFALGATSYYALTGHRPNAADRAGMRSRLLALPGLFRPDAFADTMLSMLDPDPVHRPTRATPWAHALVDAAGVRDELDDRTLITRVPSVAVVGGGALAGGSMVYSSLPPPGPPTAPVLATARGEYPPGYSDYESQLEERRTSMYETRRRRRRAAGAALAVIGAVAIAGAAGAVVLSRSDDPSASGDRSTVPTTSAAVRTSTTVDVDRTASTAPLSSAAPPTSVALSTTQPLPPTAPLTRPATTPAATIATSAPPSTGAPTTIAPTTTPATTVAPETSAPTTAAPETTVPATAAPETSAAPSGPVGDLGLSTPISKPACDSSYVVMVAAFSKPGADADNVAAALRRNPGSSYMRTASTCSSLRGFDNDGDPIYSVFYGPFGSKSEACSMRAQARASTASDAYVRRLDNSSSSTHVVRC